jgi:hypothetical protein
LARHRTRGNLCQTNLVARATSIPIACGALLLVGMVASASPRPQEPSSHANALSVTVSNAFGHDNYELSCDPPGGNTPDPASLCRAVRSHPEVLLEEKGPPCWGGTWTIHLHVSGVWDGAAVDADVDTCTANPAGEELWMSTLPEPPTFRVDSPVFTFTGANS